MSKTQIITLVVAIVGAVCGVLGAVLGIINTWYQLSKDKVRLRVIPKVAFVTGNAGAIIGDRPNAIIHELLRQRVPPRLCIEVVNLSAFPITVSDVGFGRTTQRRHVLINPEVTRGKTWPTRLEPREAVTAFARLGEGLDPAVMSEPVAYAETDCGVIQYGTSPIFQEYVASLRSPDGEDT